MRIKEELMYASASVLFFILILTDYSDCTKHRKRHRLNKFGKLKIKPQVIHSIATRKKHALDHKDNKQTKDDLTSKHRKPKAMSIRTYVANPFDQLGDLLGINGAFIPSKDRKTKYTKGTIHPGKARPNFNPHQFVKNELPVKKSDNERVMIPDPKGEAREISDIVNAVHREEKQNFYGQRVSPFMGNREFPYQAQSMYRYQGPLHPEPGAFERPMDLSLQKQQLELETEYNRQRQLNQEVQAQPPFDNGGRPKQFVPNMEYTDAVPVPNINTMVGHFGEDPKHDLNHVSKGKYNEEENAEVNLPASELAGLAQSMNLFGTKKNEYSHDLIKKLQLDPTWDYVEANLANQVGNHPRINSPASGNSHQNKIESAMEPPEGTPIGKPYVPNSHHLAAAFMQMHNQQGVLPSHQIESMRPLAAHQPFHQVQNPGPISAGAYHLTGITVQGIKSPWLSLEISDNSQGHATKATDAEATGSNEPTTELGEGEGKPDASKLPLKDMKAAKITDNESQAEGPVEIGKGGDNEEEGKPMKRPVKVDAKKPSKGKALKGKKVSLSYGDRILQQLASAGLDKIVKDFTVRLQKLRKNKENGKLEETPSAGESGAQEETQPKVENKVQGEGEAGAEKEPSTSEQAAPPESEKTATESSPNEETDLSGTKGLKSPLFSKEKSKPKDLTTNFVKFLEDMAGKLKVDRLKVAEQLVKDVEKSGKSNKFAGKKEDAKETKEGKEVEEAKVSKEPKEPKEEKVDKEASEVKQETEVKQTEESPESNESNESVQENKTEQSEEGKEDVAEKETKEGKDGKQELTTLDTNLDQEVGKPVSNLLPNRKLGVAIASLLPFRKISSKLLRETALLHGPYRPVLKNAFLKQSHVAAVRKAAPAPEAGALK